MTTSRTVLVAVVACCLLICVDIALKAFRAQRDATARRFSIQPLHTNGASGVLISDRTKDQPIWGVWNLKDGDTMFFYFQGKRVMEITSVPEGRWMTEVFLYGKDGNLVSHWRAREKGVFFMRTLIGENGPRSDVWVNETWNPIEMRTNQGKAEAGTVVEGKWRRLITTNGLPGLED